jgi:signal peptidase I
MFMHIFENQLQEGSIILLNKFGVGENTDKFPVIKHSYKLIFYRHTTVTICQEFLGPLYGFLFVDFDHIINGEVEFENTVG